MIRPTALLVAGLLIIATAALAAQHRNSDGSVSDDVLIQVGGAVIGSGNPLPTAPAPVTVSQSIVTLAAGISATLVAANPARKSLRWMVTGTNPVTIAPGTGSVAAGGGMNYNGGQGAGYQGGSEAFEGSTVPTGAFSAISTSGTTVVIWEGQ